MYGIRCLYERSWPSSQRPVPPHFRRNGRSVLGEKGTNRTLSARRSRWGGDHREFFRRPKVTKVWVPSSPSSRPNHEEETPAIDSAWSTCSGAALRSAAACILAPEPTHPPLRHDGRFLLRAALRAAGSQDCLHERVAHSSARGGPLVRPQTTLSGAMQLNQSAIICCSLTLASSCRHARSWCAEGDSPPRDQQDDHLHLPVISSRCGAQRARVAGDTPPCIALLSRLQQPRVAEPVTPPDPAPLTRWCPDCISTAGGVGQNGR